VEAALGDISRTISRMADALVTDWSAEMADLEHVAELIRVLANREETPCQ
jgi:hypothetical protein